MDALDRHMRADEARLLENNSLAHLSAAERKALYRSTSALSTCAQCGKVLSDVCDAGGGNSRRNRHMAGDELDDMAGPLTYLGSSSGSEVLPCERDERVLAGEYTRERDLQVAQRIVGEDDDGKQRASSTATERARKICEDHKLDALHRAQLYELARASPTTAGADAYSAHGATLASTVPGPYLSFDGKGRFTHYEAIVHRPPAPRSAASIMRRNCTAHTKQRSKHYPAARKAAVALPALESDSEEDGQVTSHEPRHVSHLARWQHSMGLTVATADESQLPAGGGGAIA